MTCHTIIGEDGSKMTICTSNAVDNRCELKKAMVCRKWEVCEECDSYEICQRMLEKRKLRESE